MFTKEIATKVIDECLSTGADFAELFYEDTYSTNIRMFGGKVENVSSNHIYGCGIRILKGAEETYGYTSDVTIDNLLALGKNLASSFDGKPLGIKYELKEEDAPKHAVNIERLSKDVPAKEKISYLKKCYNAVKDYSELITQIVNGFEDKTQFVTIANSEGKFIHDIRNPQRISISVVSSHEGRKQSNSSTIGGSFSIDEFKKKDLVGFARNVAKSSVTMVDAAEMVGGVYPVIIHNGFGGVLFHEACGHPLEASSVAKGVSVFSGKEGAKIASDVVCAIDDGSVYNEWGSLNVDDEGNKTQKNVLIQNGKLTSYMIDMKNGRLMGKKATGNSRRQNYKYSPTSRMTNTYIANGESTFEEIIAATKFGLFAKELGGGSVNPATGEFNFAVNEGYMVEDGKITYPVRGATLVGNGANALLNIDMVGNNQSFGHGMCGASSGSICANVGEPTIRIQNMTVGGNGGRE